jgi:hypothetical protein
MHGNARFQREAHPTPPILTRSLFPPSSRFTFQVSSCPSPRAHAILQNEAKCHSVSHRAPAQNEANPTPAKASAPTPSNVPKRAEMFHKTHRPPAQNEANFPSLPCRCTQMQPDATSTRNASLDPPPRTNHGMMLIFTPLNTPCWFSESETAAPGELRT